MFLVTISWKTILNFPLNFSKRQEGPSFNGRYVYFLVFKRLVNKNFNCLIFSFKEIMTFLVKTIISSAKFPKNFQKLIP